MPSKDFTSKQKEIVARKLGYDGPMSMFDEFLKSDPGIANKYGLVLDKYMAKGGAVVKRLSEGSLVTDPNQQTQGQAGEPSELNKQIIMAHLPPDPVDKGQGTTGTINTLPATPPADGTFNTNVKNVPKPSELSKDFSISNPATRYDEERSKIREQINAFQNQLPEYAELKKLDEQIRKSGNSPTAAQIQQAELLSQKVRSAVENTPMYKEEQRLSAQGQQQSSTQGQQQSSTQGQQQSSTGKFSATAQAYFDKNPDVFDAYKANNYGLTPDEFVNTHYQRYGASEKRLSPAQAAQPSTSVRMGVDPTTGKPILVGGEQAGYTPKKIAETEGQLISGSGGAGKESTAKVTKATSADAASAPTSLDAKTYEATQAQTGMAAEMGNLTAQTKEVSAGAKVSAETGTVSKKAVADKVSGTAATTRAVQDRVLQEGEKISAAGTDVSAEQATAQQTLQKAKAEFAKGTITDAQLAEAQSKYDAITVKAATGTVEDRELVKGIDTTGLKSEQANAVESSYKSTLQAAKAKVEAGETVDPKDYYALPPTQVAELQNTAVQDAAKLSKYPSSDAASTAFKSDLQAAQGSVGANELVNAKDIIGTAQAVQAVAVTVQELDKAAIAVAQQGTLSQAALARAEQGEVNQQATLQGQMSSLMQQFNNGTPAWAAGAMRAANAAMAARGLGSSSMAGAAIVQATMEAALPIAAQDAQTFASMGLANLNNRQQVALSNAAAQQNIELTNLNNKQQASLQNSSNAFALQMQNMSNQQAVVLSNAQLRAAFQEKTLDINSQTALANAARYAEVNNLNLNNSQQVALQKSGENLQIDLANLSNQQQTALSNLQVQAALTGQELSNDQQMAVLKTTQTFESAKFDATAKQQAFMQDAASRAALEGKSMDIRQQTALFNAARIAEVNNINTTNAQQVALQKSTEALQVDIQNLSSRQQTELANAQLRAALQNKVLDSKTQAELVNASRYAEQNKINLSNQQQAFVQDAIIKSTMEGKVLDNKQQAALFNAARQAQVADINLSNEQQSKILETTQNLQIDLANLNNKQQTDLANAQLRAALQNKVLDNKQQAAIINASKISEIAGMNFNAKQQTALQDSTLAQQMNVANLNAEQATTLANAATYATMDMANLNNRQQAAVQNAQTFLQMDIQNLNNEQQTSLFKSQQIAQSVLSDAAASNAAKQFNATSEMQTNQFFESLKTDVSKFNTAQTNAMNQFNAGQENAMSQFNAAQTNAREQFNATQKLVIDQSNAEWRRNVATADTAAINRANEVNAQMATQVTLSEYNANMQTYRDSMQYAYQAGENDLDRENRLAIAKIQENATIKAAEVARTAAAVSALGGLAATVLGKTTAGQTLVDAAGKVIKGITGPGGNVEASVADMAQANLDLSGSGVLNIGNPVIPDSAENYYIPPGED